MLGAMIWCTKQLAFTPNFHLSQVTSAQLLALFWLSSATQLLVGWQEKPLPKARM